MSNMQRGVKTPSAQVRCRTGAPARSCRMPTIAPLTASGSRDVEKRPRPVPKHVRDMIVFMVRGRPEDPEGKALDFIEAGKLAGLKPDVARRWLDRGEVRALLHKERRAYREAICAGNEGALRRVRDTSENGMAVIGSVRTLEQLNEDDVGRPGHSGAPVPGFIIVISPPPTAGAPKTIDVTPQSVEVVSAPGA
jgi:hypothetical protein